MFYIILSLGAKFILNNIKFVFLSILAFIFSYALLKDFYSKHFYKKGNILGFMMKLLECKKFLTFYLIFLLLSFVFRNIIRSGVLFLLEKDDIFCYTLVVLLSITIIIYISNILWKVLNSLLWIFSGWIYSASPHFFINDKEIKNKDSASSSATEIKENITAEDFSLFNKKVTDNVTIYNCVYIIFIIYINQNFPDLYFMIIVCCFIILLIIFLLFSIKKNIVIFSPVAAAQVKAKAKAKTKAKASSPHMNQTLKSAIPLNSATIIGIIGGSLSTAHLGLDDAIDSTGWRFGNGKDDKIAANQYKVIIYGVNIVNNWMEFLKLVNINGNKKLYNIAFLDQNYFVDFPHYTINNTSTIYNILNSDSQLKRFFEFIRLKPEYNNQSIFLTGDQTWNNIDITKAPRYDMVISHTN
uniref:hypothetical protein n=1 Tax=Clonostachys byssicola TaxID=160290 RepID=UPI0023D84827|nr:hypothetical protein P2Y30_mgp21 [Clonostachys byssicola]WDQ44264.1 hypothetical protein [Clonostachys byssicola]